MVSVLRRFHPRRRHLAIPLVAAVGVVAVLLAAFAVAKSLTLEIAKAAKVVNTAGVVSHESLAVTAAGSAVYYLTGDSRQHPKCTSICQRFWFPVTAPAGGMPTKPSALRGALGIWHRGSVAQLTLAGRPLYTFIQDHRRHVATGEGIASFGGIWHVIPQSSRSRSQSPSTSSTTSTTSTTSPYGY